MISISSPRGGRKDSGGAVGLDHGHDHSIGDAIEQLAQFGIFAQGLDSDSKPRTSETAVANELIRDLAGQLVELVVGDWQCVAVKVRQD